MLQRVGACPFLCVPVLPGRARALVGDQSDFGGTFGRTLTLPISSVTLFPSFFLIIPRPWTWRSDILPVDRTLFFSSSLYIFVFYELRKKKKRKKNPNPSLTGLIASCTDFGAGIVGDQIRGLLRDYMKALWLFLLLWNISISLWL